MAVPAAAPNFFASNFIVFSFIDIAIDAGKKVSRFDINEARSMFEKSNIIFKIDIVDYHVISDALRKQIDKDGALWSD